MIKANVIVLLMILFCGAAGSAATATRVTLVVDAFGRSSDLREDWGFAALVEHNGVERIQAPAAAVYAAVLEDSRCSGLGAVGARGRDFVVVQETVAPGCTSC